MKFREVDFLVLFLLMWIINWLIVKFPEISSVGSTDHLNESKFGEKMKKNNTKSCRSRLTDPNVERKSEDEENSTHPNHSVIEITLKKVVTSKCFGPGSPRPLWFYSFSEGEDSAVDHP